MHPSSKCQVPHTQSSSVLLIGQHLLRGNVIFLLSLCDSFDQLERPQCPSSVDCTAPSQHRDSEPGRSQVWHGHSQRVERVPRPEGHVCGPGLHPQTPQGAALPEPTGARHHVWRDHLQVRERAAESVSHCRREMPL